MSKAETYKWPSNRKVQIIYSLKHLATNLIIWNIFGRIIIYLNLLVNPEYMLNAAKIFQILHNNMLMQTLLISLVAFCSWLLEDVFLFKTLAKKSIGTMFLLRILFVIAMLFFTFIIVSVAHYRSAFFTDISAYFSLLTDFLINPSSAYLFITGILVATFINFFKALEQKIGFEKFWPYLTGAYQTPKEEERIFLFIDLISSTKTAEKLGHKKYSNFLQQCFKYLGILELKYRAMQYQFVGDEVVLSWPAKKKNYLYAVQFFYEYISVLDSKASRFKEKFGIVPKFTASINSGNVMISEVGTVKSEIAFHGDVLNTAAKIQKECKSYGEQILITRQFATELEKYNPDLEIVRIGENKISGKKEPVEILTVNL